MRQYVIYARKSSESEERQALSIPSQIEELQKLATRERIRVARVFEEAQSAKEPGRPVFGKLMAEVNRGRVAGILCWKPDRLSRNAIDAGQLVNAMDRGHLASVITSGRTFRAGSDDKFFLGLEFSIGKKYVDDLSDNVKRGMRRKLEMGWFPHRPPVGWYNEPRLRTIVKDPDVFPVVRRMWDLVLARVPPKEVLRIATEDWGFRMRQTLRQGARPMSLSSMYAMLHNPFYAGLIRSGSTVEQGSHEAMVTREEFDEVQAILGRELKSAPQRHVFPLAGILRCGSCGGFVGGTVHRKKNGLRFAYYRCTHRQAGRRCYEPHVRAEDVERQFSQFVAQFETTPELLDLARSRIQEMAEAETGHAREAARRRRDAIAEKERILQNLVSLRARDLVRDEEYIAERGKVLSELQELRACRDSVAGWCEPTLNAISFAATARKRFEEGSDYEKHAIASAICANSVLRDKKLVISAQKPFAHLLDEEGFLGWWYGLRYVRPVGQRSASRRSMAARAAGTEASDS